MAKELNEQELLSEDTELVFHAGKAYYEQLLPLVDTEVGAVRIPTEGLALGNTLAWYNAH